MKRANAMNALLQLTLPVETLAYYLTVWIVSNAPFSDGILVYLLISVIFSLHGVPFEPN